MRRALVLGLIGCFLLAAVPSAVLAGDSHAVRNRWAGAAIGAGAVTLGGILLNAISGPAVIAAPPVVYSPPPPVVYVQPPVVVYPAPPAVVYAPAPVAIYPGWGPPGHWKKWRRHHHWKHEREWDD